MGQKFRALESLEPGDHLCCIYETEEQRRAVLGPFIRQGLEQGEKVLYVADARGAEAVTGCLEEDGLDAEPYLARGQLGILSAETCVLGGISDPDAMIALLQEETRRAIDEGYRALRVAGEMAWALRGLPGSERLIEFETKLDEFLPGSRCLAICQYDRRRFDPALLLDVLSSHPAFVAGTEAYENFYYIPPADLLGPDASAKKLGRWLDNLAELKRAEDALGLTEFSVERSGVATFWLDSEARVLRVNDATCSALGYSREELLSMTVHDFDPDYPKEVWSDHWRELKRRRHMTFESRHRAKDGRIFPVEIDINYFEYGGKELNFAFARDVTERKRAEEALRRSEERYRTLVENSPDCIKLFDLEGRYLSINRAGIEALGRPLEEILGREYVEDLDPADRPSVRQAISRAARGEVVNVEARSGPGAPRAVVWFITLVALRDPQGEVEKLLCCARDITERKQAERALRRANEQLELLSRLKDEFLSMASHELKTPVTSIRMLSEIATRHPGKVQPEVMESLTRQSDQLVRLVNDLLDVSRFQLDRVRLQFERRDLRELLSEVCALSRDVYRDHPVHCQLPPEPILVQADSTRLIQVLQNLIDNAAKYSPVGSPVDIIVEPGPSQATIAINDQGAGIAPEDLPHIFERFYKPKRQQAVLPGLGLGLYISKEIVERHGGRIWAESELGKGSTFFVEVPLAENCS